MLDDKCVDKFSSYWLAHYCSVCPHCDNYDPAFFGAGTKLTVLGKRIFTMMELMGLYVWFRGLVM